MRVVNNDKLSPTFQLRIAFCLPEQKWLFELMSGELTDAAHIQQGYIARGLQSRDHDITFIAPDNYNRLACSSDLKSLNIVQQSWSGRQWFDFTRKGVWQIQRRLRIPFLNVFSNYCYFDSGLQCLPGHDLVYERNGIYNVGIAMACKRLRIPYVMFFDADQILELDYLGEPITGILRWRAKNMLRYNLAVAACVVCVSEQSRSHLITTWNVPAEKLMVISNGVDVQRFQPNSEARTEVRVGLGVDNITPMIVFVGSFHEWHDVSTLLDAFALVLTADPEVRLFLVGEGRQRQAMVHRVIDLGIDHAVHFTGRESHAEIPRLIAAADIAVAPVPQMEQNLWLSPMKLFEYMASGTAVVASNVGQLAHVVKDGRNGLLVPPGDAEAMAVALKRLIDNADLRARLGQQARQDAVNNHSWERYVSRLESVFTAVISGNSVAHL